MMTQNTPKKILLVDDSQSMRAYLRDVLQRAFPGAVVVLASDLVGGVTALTGQNNLSGVVTDFILGENGQTGLEMLTLYLNAAGKSRPALPMVLITQGGKLSPVELASTQKLGIHVLPKPTPETEDSFIASLQGLMTLC